MFSKCISFQMCREFCAITDFSVCPSKFCQSHSSEYFHGAEFQMQKVRPPLFRIQSCYESALCLAWSRSECSFVCFTYCQQSCLCKFCIQGSLNFIFFSWCAVNSELESKLRFDDWSSAMIWPSQLTRHEIQVTDYIVYQYNETDVLTFSALELKM